MAITIDRCPHCGTPYMSALLPGESPAQRFCDNCNRRAGDPKNAAPSAPKPAPALKSVDDDLMLQPVESDQPAGVPGAAGAAVVTTHKQPDARGQIIGQIQAKGGPAIPGLPADAPIYDGPRKPPLMTVASGIRLAVLLVVLVIVAKYVYSVYQKTFNQPIAPTAPAAPTPTVAEMTKPPVKTPEPAKPAPPPAPAKPAEKKPDVASAKPPAPAQQPKELATEGKPPSPSGPGGDINALLASDSRQKSRANDDEDSGEAAATSPAKPSAPIAPTPQPGAKPPAANKDPNAPDPMIAMLEKSKSNPNTPPGNTPPRPQNAPNGQNGPNGPGRTQAGFVPPRSANIGPGANPNAPGVVPGQQQTARPGSLLPQGPITSSVPTIVQIPQNAVSGVTFLVNYPGWFCRDYDDAHSLRESFFYNRPNVIMLTPTGRNPAKLIAMIEIPKQAAGKKPELILEVTTKDKVHAWLLHGSIEGADVLRQTEVRPGDARNPWQEIHIDLSNFIDRRFMLQLEVVPPPGKNPIDYSGYMRNPHLNWKK